MCITLKGYYAHTCTVYDLRSYHQVGIVLLEIAVVILYDFGMHVHDLESTYMYTVRLQARLNACLRLFMVQSHSSLMYAEI